MTSFLMSLKNGSGCKSKQPNQGTFSDLYLSWLPNGACCKLQSEFQISLFRFMTLPKFRPRCKLNQLNQRTLSFWADYRMGHTGGYSQNFKFPSSDSQSSQHLGLDASWMKQIKEGHPILSWCPNTIFGIAHATGWIRHPYVDIQNLLENLMEMSTLTNQAIYGVMWPSDLKLHQKMLSNDTYIIPFE